MNWEELLKISSAILASLGGATLILLAFSSWLGKVWANRILEADRARYNSEIEAIRYNNQNYLNTLGTTSSAYIESKKVFTQNRMEAIKTIWNEVIRIRDERPSAIVWLDMLRPSEYDQFKKNSKFEFIKKTCSIEEISKLTNSAADLARPFLDDQSYSYFWAYRALTGRLAFYVWKLRETGDTASDWREEKSIIEAINPVLNQEELLSLKREKWDTTVLFNYLETSLSNHLKKLASGVELAEETLEHVMSFHKAASELKKIEEKEKHEQA